MAGASKEGLVYIGKVHLDLRLVILDWGFSTGEGGKPLYSAGAAGQPPVGFHPRHPGKFHPRHPGSRCIVRLQTPARSPQSQSLSPPDTLAAPPLFNSSPPTASWRSRQHFGDSWISCVLLLSQASTLSAVALSLSRCSSV